MKTYFLIIILLLTNIIYSHEQIRTLRKLSLVDFENTINSTMGYDTIISRYGSPTKITGSGLAILIYTLIDSTTVTIGCHSKGTVYAKYCDKNGIIRDLICNPSPDQSQNKKKIKKSKYPRQNLKMLEMSFYHDFKLTPKHNTVGIIHKLVTLFTILLPNSPYL